MHVREENCVKSFEKVNLAKGNVSNYTKLEHVILDVVPQRQPLGVSAHQHYINNFV